MRSCFLPKRCYSIVRSIVRFDEKYFEKVFNWSFYEYFMLGRPGGELTCEIC